MKLELKHLSPYLPYGLKWIDSGGTKYKMLGIDIGIILTDICNPNERKRIGFMVDKEKPILRPLSDIGGKIICKDVMDKLRCSIRDVHDLWDLNSGTISLDELPVSAYDVSCRNNLDIFGLIEAGLAIDINTLEPCH